MSAPEYRVDFSILRRLPGEDDYTEVGFGSTPGDNATISDAAHDALSALQNDEWDEV